MEEILQILKLVAPVVLIVIAVISRSSKKQYPETSPEEALEEMFPDTDDLQPEEKAPQAQTIRPIPIKRTSKKSCTPRVELQQVTPTAPPSKTERIKLSTRAEARKAFIYSEIFNRKYQ